MQFTHAGDYDSRYRGTFIGVPSDDDGIKPLLVEGITRHDGGLAFVGRYYNEQGRAYGAAVEVPVRQEGLQLAPPKLGLVHDDGELLYIWRRPHRRWKQGLSLDSTGTRWFVESAGGESRVNVYRVFNPDYTPLTEALEIACGVNRRGFMITLYVGVVSSSSDGHAHVVYRSNKVGDYNRERSTLILKPQCSSLVDTMRRAGFENVEVQQ